MKYWLAIVLFLFVFSFRVPIFVNSAYIAVIVIFFHTIITSKARNLLISVLKIRYILIFYYMVSLFAVCFSVLVIIKGTLDFTFLSSYLNLVVSSFFCICFVVLLISRNEASNIYEYFYIILFLQSIFVLLMMFLPDIRDVIQSFTMTEDDISRMSTYMGVRGLGLSGSIAFGFSIVMALLVLLSSRWMFLERKRSNIYENIFVFFIFSFASLSAGRTAIIGITFAVFYFFYLNVKRPMVILKYLAVLCKILALFFLIYIAFIDSNSPIHNILTYYSKYVFQSIYNYLETGTFAVSSVSILMDKMYFIPPGDVLFGDARYVSENGSYYMGTDAGYMRYVLLFGVIGSVFLYVLYILTFVVVGIKGSISKSVIILFILTITMSFILHYKGEVIMYNVAFMKLIFMFLLYEYIRSENIRVSFI